MQAQRQEAAVHEAGVAVDGHVPPAAALRQHHDVPVAGELMDDVILKARPLPQIHGRIAGGLDGGDGAGGDLVADGDVLAAHIARLAVDLHLIPAVGLAGHQQGHAVIEDAQDLRTVAGLRPEVQERAAVLVGHQRHPAGHVSAAGDAYVVLAHVAAFAVGRDHPVEIVLAADDLHPGAPVILPQPRAGGASLRAQVQAVRVDDDTVFFGQRPGAERKKHPQRQYECGQLFSFSLQALHSQCPLW